MSPRGTNGEKLSYEHQSKLSPLMKECKINDATVSLKGESRCPVLQAVDSPLHC